MSSSDGEETTLLPSPQPIASFKRWIVLASFSLLTMTNSWMWITWSPIENAVAQRWNVTDSSVDGLSMVFMYLYIPLSFPALYLLQKIGMRNGLIIGAIINSIGAAVRWQGVDNYTTIYVGTLLCSAAQTFTLAIPPLLSHAWFPSSERALATSIGVLANQLGTCLGLGATLIVDLSNESGNIKAYLGVQCLTAVIANVLVVVFVTNGNQKEIPVDLNHTNEENDQNNNQNNENNTSYINSLRKVLCVRNGIVLNIMYCLVVGVFYAIATFLSQLLPLWRVNDPKQQQVGLLGITLVVGGVLGSISTGKLLDKKIYTFHQLTTRLLMACTLSFLVFTTVINLSSSFHLGVFLVTGIIGFFLTAIVSVGMEYGTVLASGINEGIVAGIYNVSAQAGGVILVLIGGFVLGDENGTKKTILTLNLTLSGVLLIAGILYVVGFDRLQK